MVNMKLIYLCAFLILVACSPQKQSASTQANPPKKNKLEIKPGYQLNYNLASGGERYQFVVELKKMNPDINFDYTLTMKNIVNGNMTISNKAKMYVNTMQNYFRSGNNLLPDSVTTVWASQKTYREIVETGKCILDDGERKGWSRIGKVEYDFFGKEKYTCEVNGESKTFDVLRIIGKSGNRSEFLILDDPNNPLIIKMRVNFERSVKEIYHPF